MSFEPYGATALEWRAVPVHGQRGSNVHRGLAEHFDSVPSSPAQGSVSLRKQFERHGFVLIRSLGSAATFLELFNRLGHIYRNHDSMDSGLTHGRSDPVAQTDTADALCAMDH
jgi:hypothetical protein